MFPSLESAGYIGRLWPVGTDCCSGDNSSSTYNTSSFAVFAHDLGVAEPSFELDGVRLCLKSALDQEAGGVYFGKDGRHYAPLHQIPKGENVASQRGIGVERADSFLFALDITSLLWFALSPPGSPCRHFRFGCCLLGKRPLYGKGRVFCPRCSKFTGDLPPLRPLDEDRIPGNRMMRTSGSLTGEAVCVRVESLPSCEGRRSGNLRAVEGSVKRHSEPKDGRPPERPERAPAGPPRRVAV